MPVFEVRRDDLRTTRLADGEAPAGSVADGEVQLRVDRFGLSANNVTYGAFGDAMSYWQFFPAGDEGWGAARCGASAMSSPRESRASSRASASTATSRWRPTPPSGRSRPGRASPP